MIRRLTALAVALLAVSALTITWRHGPTRLARKLTRRSPQSDPVAPSLSMTSNAPSVLAEMHTLLSFTTTPVVLSFSPYQRRGTVTLSPAIGLGLPALLVHPDHRPEIMRAHEFGQLPDRLRVV
ncbi:hypothetical protein GRS96_12465 [Rathayibacter sp. VKM Ac-2803]|uniref:hypothetical protein n=1 Tax=Rathayibacter sp. VKM Ac-2803 TaxID=2609256 RepID=UPI00135B02D3|nr:hypothetical protein [Rathayibacter sp. VKM Ac-2803]MWV50082.1 hypothetical protein [Rathayibacter sp. VKM Ac-2803]